MKTVGFFKNKETEWYVGITLQFNGHSDDKKAIRKAYMQELDNKGMTQAKQFLQRIEVKHDKV